MYSIPHILHFVTADRPSELTRKRIEEMRRLHPGWQVYHWTDSAPPEDGKLKHYYSKAGSGAQLADLMRLDAIATYGGVYIDSDFVLHRSLDCLVDRLRFFIGSEDGMFPTNAAFGAIAHHPAMSAMIQFLLDCEPDWTLPANQTTGPHLFKAICQWRTDIDLVPRETFYPYCWHEPARAAHVWSVGTHLWEGSWIEDSFANRMPDEPGRLGRRFRIELAKLLCTLGFKRAGEGLWNRNQTCNEGWALQDHAAQKPAGTVASYVVGNEIIVRTRHDTMLVCDIDDLSITPHIALKGVYESAEDQFLDRNLVGGDWFIDVGAGIGSHAILAATRVGPFGRVFAFEADKRRAELIERSAVLNQVHDRLKTLNQNLLDAGDIPCGEEQALDSANEARRSTTLDAAFPVDLPIKVLKIGAGCDVLAVLRSGARLFANGAIDFIILKAVVETSIADWPDYLAAFGKLMAVGYKPACLSPDGFLIECATIQEALFPRPPRTLLFRFSSGQNVVGRSTSST